MSEIIAVGALLFIRATAAQSARSEDHDEEDAYLLARGCDDRRRLGRDDDGCIRPVARDGVAVGTGDGGVADGDQGSRQGS